MASPGKKCQPRQALQRGARRVLKIKTGARVGNAHPFHYSVCLARACGFMPLSELTETSMVCLRLPNNPMAVRMPQNKNIERLEIAETYGAHTTEWVSSEPKWLKSDPPDCAPVSKAYRSQLWQVCNVTTPEVCSIRL